MNHKAGLALSLIVTCGKVSRSTLITSDVDLGTDIVNRDVDRKNATVRMDLRFL